LYRWWQGIAETRASTALLVRLWQGPSWRRKSLYLLTCVLVLGALAFLGIKALLGALLVLGLGLFCLHGLFTARSREETYWNARSRYTYLLLLVGLGISLGIEVIYIRDFLDGSDYERMNTFFKFSIQAWVCLGIGGALAIGYIRSKMRGFFGQIWSLAL